MKIIVQAGGTGSRMGDLTVNKPKALVSVNGAPILFHLFSKYPDADFIIICDYKKDVIARYLETFAKNFHYMLLSTTDKGNVAGIKDAVLFVEENEPFMIIWSDIILGADFVLSNFPHGCQVGLANIPSRWSLKGGKLYNSFSEGLGVAGVWVFDNKSWFSDCPSGGSFTKWLQQKDIPLYPLLLKNSQDVGTLELYNNATSKDEIRSRPYNKIRIIGDKVQKIGINTDANILIQNEARWYNYLSKFNFRHMPKIYNDSPLVLEKLNAKNLFKLSLTDYEKKKIIDNIISILKKMHSYEEKNANNIDVYTEYFVKTIRRLQAVSHAVPFSSHKRILINGTECINVLQSPEILEKYVKDNLLNISHYGIIHGDPQLTNTMVDEQNNIFYIDPRGYFGRSKIFGDVRYDWAKLYFSIAGNFDQFNIKNFKLHISDNKVDFQIASNNWEFLMPYFLAKIKPCSEKEIELIQIIIWLSMAAVAWEDFDSMCVAFYNGNYLFTKWVQKYG